MQEILWTYFQFLVWLVSEHSLLFFAVLLGTPAFWLILKLTNLMYEEKALTIGAASFGLCSIMACVQFLTISEPSRYYIPLAQLLFGILSFICVPIFYCEKANVSFNPRRKTISVDGVTVPAYNITQAYVKRCFNRSKRSCLMEIFVSEEGQRGRSLYYETNDTAEFKQVIAFLKNYTTIDYDCLFTNYTLEIPFFSLVIKVLMLSLLAFGFLIPATTALNEQKATVSLPEYETSVIPSQLYELEKLNKSTDLMASIFQLKAPQIVVFDGSHSSHFVGNYRKALNQFPNQNFDFNIVFVKNNGLQFKHSFEPKQTLTNAPEDEYTKFVTANCKKLCFIDNELKMLYSTEIETVDPRANNVQDAVNMLNFVQGKRLEQQRILEERRKAAELTYDNDDEE